MAQDPFLFFVEGVHGPPSKRDPLFQLACVRGQVDMLPRCPRGTLPTRYDGIPGCRAEVGVTGTVTAAFQDFGSDFALWEVGDRVPAWFEQQQDPLAVGDPISAKAHAHAPAQRLDIKKPRRQRLGDQKPADCSRREWTLLPG